MMSVADLLHDPLFRSIVLVIWLLPCAIQDRRTRHVSNWLTVPLFIVAWPVALLTGHFALTFAVFVGVYIATKLEPRAGAADGKLMVGMAALAPLALGIGVLLEGIAFAILRLRGRRDASIPGALWLYLGCVLSAGMWSSQALVGQAPYR
jgi:Flp pilus assembly protein protease CpaA